MQGSIKYFLVIFFLSVAILCPFNQDTAFCLKEKSNEVETKDETSESLPGDITAPFSPEKINKAGDTISKRIDDTGRNSSPNMGGSMNREICAGITWLKLCVCIFLLFIVFLLERVLRKLVNLKISNVRSEGNAAADRQLYFRAVSGPLSLFVWGYGIYLALYPMYIHFQDQYGGNLIYSTAKRTAGIVGIIALVWLLFRLTDVVAAQIKKMHGAADSSVADMKIPIVKKAFRIFILIIGIIIIIQNLTDIKIGPLLASLGIGGLAVALAAKESIANFFGTITIMFDKPFQVGERIVIDSHDGVVESVGFRSTRIRTLEGHLLTIPNEKVVSSSLKNIGRRPYIRWLTNIGITYDTPPEKVEKAVKIIEEILKDHEGIKEDFPPRVYFNGFNEWNLNIMVIAWYHPPNYWDYQAWLQKTCLEIIHRFKKEGIELAFPTQTLYLANADKTNFELKMLKGDN